jgi:ADP-heptose:LPS heptosyltransferase
MFRDTMGVSPGSSDQRSEIASPFPREIPEVGSVLVIHQGALGDFILALPVLSNLNKALRHSRLVIMGFPRILELVEKRYYADEVLSIDQKGMASFYVRDGSLDIPLSHFFKQFGLVVVFGKEGGGALLGNLKRVCGGQLLPLNSFPFGGERIHLTDHLLRQLGRYHFPIGETDPRLYLTEKDREWAKNFYEGKGLSPKERAKIIVLHPGSGSKKKSWPLDRFIELYQYLRKNAGSKILTVIGPAEGGEIQRAFEKILGETGPDAPLLAKGFSLPELASLIAGCRLFIGNDSGITHMAAALEVPTVALFGPTDPKVWAPRGENVTVIAPDIPCAPCSREQFFECQLNDCIKEIKLSDVLESLAKLSMFRKEDEHGREESG